VAQALTNAADHPFFRYSLARAQITRGRHFSASSINLPACIGNIIFMGLGTKNSFECGRGGKGPTTNRFPAGTSRVRLESFGLRLC